MIRREPVCRLLVARISLYQIVNHLISFGLVIIACLMLTPNLPTISPTLRNVVDAR